MNTHLHNHTVPKEVAFMPTHTTPKGVIPMNTGLHNHTTPRGVTPLNNHTTPKGVIPMNTGLHNHTTPEGVTPLNNHVNTHINTHITPKGVIPMNTHLHNHTTPKEVTPLNNHVNNHTTPKGAIPMNTGLHNHTTPKEVTPLNNHVNTHITPKGVIPMNTRLPNHTTPKGVIPSNNPNNNPASNPMNNPLTDQLTHALERLRTKNGKPFQPINAMISLICLAFAFDLGIKLESKKFESRRFFSQINETLKTSETLKTPPQKNNKLTEALEILSPHLVTDALMSELIDVLHGIKPPCEDWNNFTEILLQDVFLRYSQDLLVEPPKPLIKLIISLLDPVNGTVYVGAAGIATTAIEIHKNTPNLTLFTKEKNPLCHAISILRANMNRVDFSNICEGEVLTEPFLYNETTVQKFDYAVLYPPFGRSWENYEREIKKDTFHQFWLGLPSISSADWLYVQHLCAVLEKSGKGIVAIPSGALYHSSTKRIRQGLVESGRLECVVSLPPGIIANTKLPLSLLILGGTRVNSQILMLDATNLFEKDMPVRWKDKVNLSDSIIEQITEIYQSHDCKSGVSEVVRNEDLTENDCVLIPTRYMSISSIDSEFGTLHIKPPPQDGWATLKDTGIIYRGINSSPARKTVTLNEHGDYRIINYTDVQNDSIAIETLARCDYFSSEKYLVEEGDILIACKGSALKLSLVPRGCENTVLSANFAALRVNKYKFEPLYVWHYLNSPVGQSLLKSKQVGSSTIFTLALNDIESIPIPDLPLEQQKEYAAALTETENEVKQEIEALYNHAKEARLAFYENIGLGELMESRTTPKHSNTNLHEE